jgi:hypothetical protein
MKYYEKLWDKISEIYGVIGRYVSTTFFIVYNNRHCLIAERVNDTLLRLIGSDTFMYSSIANMI